MCTNPAEHHSPSHLWPLVPRWLVTNLNVAQLTYSNGHWPAEDIPEGRSCLRGLCSTAHGCCNTVPPGMKDFSSPSLQFIQHTNYCFPDLYSVSPVYKIQARNARKDFDYSMRWFVVSLFIFPFLTAKVLCPFWDLWCLPWLGNTVLCS